MKDIILQLRNSWRLYRNHRKTLITFVAFGQLIKIMTALVVPKTTQLLFDAIEAGDIASSLPGLLIAFISVVVLILLVAWMNIYGDAVATELGFSMVRGSFERIYEKPVTDVVNKYTIGETYQRIQAGSHNSVAIWFGAIDLTSSVIALVLIFLLMSYINIYILIIYIFIPVITILYSAASYKIKAKLNQSLQSEESAQMNRLHELVANLSLIKSFGASNWAAERYKNARSRAYLSKKRIIYADTILSILQDAVDFVLLSSFAFIIRIPATTWGTIGVAFLWYDNVKRKSTEFYASFVNLPNSVVPFKRLVEVTEYMQLDTAAFNRDMRDISLEHISLRYGEKNALNDVTLNIERGAKVALVGKNGSGKTSIIKIVLGLICQTSGNIALPFATYSERKNETSLTMAEPQLYETSVLENIDMCSDDVTNAQIDKSLSTLYINELRGKQASELSSGERQRVAVARAMTKNSMLMVLDEPTSALDPNTSTRVMKSILDSDATVLFTTHDIAIAKLADRIVWLEDGAIKNTFDRDEFALLNEW